MKAQFLPGGLRIRVDRAEFERIRAAEPVTLECAGLGRIDVCAARELSVTREAGVLTLRLPGTELEALAARLPCREGIEAAVELAGRVLHVTLEVDVRDGRPRRAR
jgi:hypothetical protein